MPVDLGSATLQQASVRHMLESLSALVLAAEAKLRMHIKAATGQSDHEETRYYLSVCLGLGPATQCSLGAYCGRESGQSRPATQRDG
ncbi:hypothetical protein CFAM422_002569 [Trichoderma lentiforme]|uniref:Uncharacterized protein n=1 Tax=Trichoderma lentiforme TaxID=1567552 RepID=A0A9P4XN26_9HYPO|nr:hypothetical protein CFAM422_002569 [Trichoderma lentiforme]